MRIPSARLLQVAVLSVGIMLFSVTLSTATELTAQQILDSITSSNMLTGTGQASIEVAVTSKQGQKKVQKLDIYRNDDGKGTTQQLVVFTAPVDVKGTKFLSLTTPKQETQMWLYMPALGRERLISGSATQGKFMGTDFTFEEISGDFAFTADYRPKRLSDTTVDGQDCYVLELTPKSDSAKFDYVKLVVHKQALLPVLAEFYGPSRKLEKALTLNDLQKNSKGDWQPYTITLKDTASGSSTTIRILKINNQAVSSEVFTLRYLRR